MAETPGSILQSVTDGRLTLRKAHLDYLGNPDSVDVTLGPGTGIILHSPKRRLELLKDLLGDPDALQPDDDASYVQLRLHSVRDNAPVDDQGRLRIPPMFVNYLKLPDKQAKVYLISGRGNKWVELWPEADFTTMVNTRADDWLQAFNRTQEKAKEQKQ